MDRPSLFVPLYCSLLKPQFFQFLAPFPADLRTTTHIVVFAKIIGRLEIIRRFLRLYPASFLNRCFHQFELGCGRKIGKVDCFLKVVVVRYYCIYKIYTSSWSTLIRKYICICRGAHLKPIPLQLIPKCRAI